MHVDLPATHAVPPVFLCPLMTPEDTKQLQRTCFRVSPSMSPCSCSWGSSRGAPPHLADVRLAWSDKFAYARGVLQAVLPSIAPQNCMKKAPVGAVAPLPLAPLKFSMQLEALRILPLSTDNKFLRWQNSRAAQRERGEVHAEERSHVPIGCPS